MEHIKMIDKVNLWNAGYVELWDFSNANSCQEIREETVALVSSACYGKEIANQSEHYKKMLTEHNGKASGILGFIPVIDERKFGSNHNYVRFCALDENEQFLYTNLRNLINHYDDWANIIFSCDCKDFYVVKIKVPYMIVDHLRRHKLLEHAIDENWQSNRRWHEIEHFQNEEIEIGLKKYYTNFNLQWNDCGSTIRKLSLDDFQYLGFHNKEYKIRWELINKGEFCLRYVTGWLAGWKNDPLAWDNFFSVRTTKPSQKETIELANTIRELFEKHYGEGK